MTAQYKEINLNRRIMNNILENRNSVITFVSNIGAASTSESPHTPTSDFLELLIVQMDRAFIGITITINLKEKYNYD